MGGNNKSINAFFISYGQFCSAWNGSACATPGTVNNQLTINGSVIDLSSSTPPKFVRTNGNNDPNNPAEVINYQPKYLVILKNIFSRSMTYWKEIQ